MTWTTPRNRHTMGIGGVSWSIRSTRPAARKRDRAMEPRLNIFTNEVAAKFMQRFANAAMVARSAPPTGSLELVSLRVSQINGCGWCVDMHTKEAVAAGETPLRLNLVAAWRESTVFSDAERAALAFAEEGTRLADAHEGVSDETWAWVREHFDEDQTAALVRDRKSTRLNSSHVAISYAVFCLKNKRKGMVTV